MKLRKSFRLLLAVAAASLLAACGGEGTSSDAQETHVVSAGRQTAQAAVPGTWGGRVPTMSFATTPNKNFRTYNKDDRITSEGNVGPHVRGEILVRLKSEEALSQLISYCKERRYSIVFVGSPRSLLVTVQTNLSTDSSIWAIRNDIVAQHFVANATINSIAAADGVSTPNDPAWLSSDSQMNWGLKAIKWDKALAALQGAPEYTPVGVLDEGFVFAHEDLTLNHVEPTYTRIEVDHGTHVAGIIGANWNDKGLPGVSKWAKLYVTRAMDVEAIHTAIPHAMLDARVRTINLSISNQICKKTAQGHDCEEYVGDEKIRADARWLYDSMVTEFAAYKNNGAQPPLLVKSAGNNGMRYWGQKSVATQESGLKKITAEHSGYYSGLVAWLDPQLDHHAEFSDHIIVVGSYFVDDSGAVVISDFSSLPEPNSPLTEHMIFAPGGNGSPARAILSSVSTGSSIYNYMAGTSQAAPHVTGAASLLFSINPKFTAKDVKQILLSTADRIPLPTGEPSEYRALNLEAAVKEAIKRSTPLIGLIARYTFDSCDGADESGLTRPAEFGAACTSGLKGMAAHFQNPATNTYGGNHSVHLPLHTSGSITFSSWVKWEGAVTSSNSNAFAGAIWSLGTHVQGPFMSIWINEGGVDGDGGKIWTDWFPNSPYRLIPNVWTMLSITSDGTGETLYINGEPVNSVKYPTPQRWSYVGQPSYLSKHFWANPDGGSRSWASRFRGALDEVRIFDRVLSEEEIQQLYRTSRP